MLPHKDVYPFARKLGKRLRTLREHKLWTTEELGKRANISQQQVSAIERGAVNTPVERIADLAKALGTRAEVVMTDEAFEMLQANQTRDLSTLAKEFAWACAGSMSRVTLGLSLFAAELQVNNSLHARQEEP